MMFILSLIFVAHASENDASSQSMNWLQTSSSTNQGSPSKTTIYLGQDVNYPPYAYEDARTGEPIGFGAAIAKGMNSLDTAACANLDIQVVKTKWADCWTPNGIGERLKQGTELHACMTYTHTKGQRPKECEFSYGILDVNKAAGLLVELGDDGTPLVDGNSNLAGKTVVDVGGWAPTADGLGFVENKCTKKNYAHDAVKLVMAEGADNNNDEALKMLLGESTSGTKADAMFVYSDQAYHYQKKCKEDPNQAWTCSNWLNFGTEFAYAQTGQFGYVQNGTTLAMAKLGSGYADLLNPCLVDFMQTEAYYKACEDHDFVDSCYPNKYFPRSGDIVKHSYMIPTEDQTGDCSDGYCPCPE